MVEATNCLSFHSIEILFSLTKRPTTKAKATDGDADMVNGCPIFAPFSFWWPQNRSLADTHTDLPHSVSDAINYYLTVTWTGKESIIGFLRLHHLLEARCPRHILNPPSPSPLPHLDHVRQTTTQTHTKALFCSCRFFCECSWTDTLNRVGSYNCQPQIHRKRRGC